jgi:hypothetical protein
MEIDRTLLENAQIISAGGFGGIIAAFFSQKLPYIKLAIIVASGFPFAAIFARPLAKGVWAYWNISGSPQLDHYSMCGFAAGLVGMAACKFGLAIFEAALKLNLRDIILRLIPQGK